MNKALDDAPHRAKNRLRDITIVYTSGGGAILVNVTALRKNRGAAYRNASPRCRTSSCCALPKKKKRIIYRYQRRRIHYRIESNIVHASPIPEPRKGS
jgi:hypothetical protein